MDNMKFLIDTNILIPLEPGTYSDLEVNSELAYEFLKLLNKSGNTVFVHPATFCDIAKDKNTERRDLRKRLAAKYQIIEVPPKPDILDEDKVGRPRQNSHDWIDNNLVAALFANTVDYLVTEDVKIHQKARRLNLSSRVLLLSDAVVLLKNLFDKEIEPPPDVKLKYTYEIDLNSDFFDSLKEDYEGFEVWFKETCNRGHRRAYVIENNGKLAAICIIKKEKLLPDATPGKTLKLCTVKVSEKFQGNYYGELLLKAVFDYANSNKYKYMYFTAFPKQKKLILFSENFGFYKLSTKSKEKIFVKSFVYTKEESLAMSAIDLNIKHGPYVTKFVDNESFVVPIMPGYHSLLFPELEKQKVIFSSGHPCGNSIRKAYLCHSNTDSLRPGDNLFFYRSRDIQGLTVLGIVEDTFKSKKALDITKFVGKRTVYSYNEIQGMCHKEVLAIKFRLVLLFDKSISCKSLMKNNVLRGAPQSITKIRGNLKWLIEKIKM